MHVIASEPKFLHPFTMLLAGSTGSGKTQWLMRLLEHVDMMIDAKLSILYCYGEVNEYTLALNSHPRCTTHHGVPTEQQIKDASKASCGKLLLVLDDLLVNLRAPFLDTLFTKGSHNWNVSVILVTQNAFARELRVARTNSHYLVLMRNPAGELQVRTLGAQLFAKRLPYFLESYRDATRERFSYLLIDMHPKSDDQLRLRTHIFPNEITVAYIAKDNQ